VLEVEKYRREFDEIVDALQGVEDAWRALTEPARKARWKACVDNPALFAWTYLQDHLRLPDGSITFSDLHFDWYLRMREWMGSGTTWRRSFVSPRESAKTTTWFLFAPMWAAAYGWAKFVAAFSESGTQAEMHLSTFKRELESNELLRYDFPSLCAVMMGERGQPVANNQIMTIRRNGFVFGARGVDAANLGMKVGNQRPDVIILDDIEPDASNYST
jgi:hypothetical protein